MPGGVEVLTGLGGQLSGHQKLSGSLTGSGSLSGTMANLRPFGEYTGSYEFTPSASQQTIAVENKLVKQDIVINPIPSNYGLITWDGTNITVS